MMRPQLAMTPNEVPAIALALIDPAGTLTPGSVEYGTIREMIEGWIERHGCEQAVCMARLGAMHLERWRKFL